MHGTLEIRCLLGELRSEDFAGAVRILYGGSIKPGSVAEVVDGGPLRGRFVGLASAAANAESG